MREILFRGKQTGSGEWVYGSLITETNPFDKNMVMTHIYDNGCNEILVDPRTIGQYTGMTDKNGARIFEGDIVKISNDEIFEVKYEDGRFTAGLFLGDWDYGHVEVIGNIYDNPELVEVAEND